jgi:hypothetical protein
MTNVCCDSLFVDTDKPREYCAASPHCSLNAVLLLSSLILLRSLFIMASSSSSSPELSPLSHTHPPNPYKYATIDEVLDDLSR